MVITKDELEELPPSYDELARQSQATTSAPPRDLKVPVSRPSTGSDAPSTPTTPVGYSESQSRKGKGKETSKWWSSFSMSTKAREVRNTVLGIIRDVVQQGIDGGAGGKGILESCNAACMDEGISFSTLLQERSIEDHTPIYWAIVNRNPQQSQANSQFDLLLVLLSYAAPLEPATVNEIKQACLITSDQQLFQKLRLSPEFSAVSGKDQMVLGTGTVSDEVEVLEITSDEGAFVVDVKLMQFQKRMRVSGEVGVDFIARGRIWRLAFRVSTEKWRHDRVPFGSWYASVMILENSPPTWIDSQLLIPDASMVVPPLGETSLANVSPVGRDGKKVKPTLKLRLMSRSELGAAQGRHISHGQEVVAALDSALGGNSLQFSGSSYIGADDSLRIRFEGRLGKPQEECVIC